MANCKSADRSREPKPGEGLHGETLRPPAELLCPSFSPRAPGKGVVFGIVVGTPEQPAMIPLEKPEPVTEEIFQLAAPFHPSEVFRIAAPCVEGGCKNFGKGTCHLAKAVVREPEVVAALRPCRIRLQCLWWHQEGRAACLRCPGVLTNNAATLALRTEKGC